MTLRFHPLAAANFPQLLTWLESPHVHTWWDPYTTWTLELVAAKYTPYLHASHLHAFVLTADDQPIGYMQYYDTKAFLLEAQTCPLLLPTACAGLDGYIGNSLFLGQGIFPQALMLFLTHHVPSRFAYSVADPDTANQRAIRAYMKAGFVLHAMTRQTTWLLLHRHTDLHASGAHTQP